MTANEMIEWRNRLPFTPFEIRLKDGSKVRVKHSYEIATGRNSGSCAVFENDDYATFVNYRDVIDVVVINGS